VKSKGVTLREPAGRTEGGEGQDWLWSLRFAQGDDYVTPTPYSLLLTPHSLLPTSYFSLLTAHCFKRVFEAEIEEQRVLVLGLETDGVGDPGDDLEAALKIEGPAETGI